MDLDATRCYTALSARDTRFDGAFFVGVTSTKIYCRPICPARTPRADRCRFYKNAASAERDGFRPCRRCRPELAPGKAPVDAAGRLAAEAARRIDNGALDGDGRLTTLASALGVTDRHLRRTVERAFGVSPGELARTRRLLMACRLLTDTTLPVIDIALASGFSSLRRFNAAFSERYRLRPTDLRRVKKPLTASPNTESLRFELSYRPPLDWKHLIGYFAGRGAAGVEAIDGAVYRRTLSWPLSGGRVAHGWLSAWADDERSCVGIELSVSLLAAVGPILSRARRVFDLDMDPAHVASGLGELAQAHPGLRLPGAFDGFELAVRAILGQQVSVASATTLHTRLSRTFGAPIETPFANLDRLAPTASALAKADPADLRAQGIVTARADAIVALARAVRDGLVLAPGADIDDTKARLLAVRGIGPWTAEYIVMRALSWPDIFPAGDLALRRALDQSDERRAREQAERYRPWRSYAAQHLWAGSAAPRVCSMALCSRD